jgi:hypothetical protein
MVGGAALASLLCGPGAPVCAAAITGIAAAAGAYAGSELGADVASQAADDVGW